MWRQRQGGLSLTRSLSLHELALNHGLTQLQHHQTLQCLWADFQAVFELWNVVFLPGHLQTFLFSSLQIAEGGSPSCGVGAPQNIDCVCFLHPMFTTSVSLKQQVPSLIAKGFGWLQLHLLPLALKWHLLVLVHGDVGHWVFTTSLAIIPQQILDVI